MNRNCFARVLIGFSISLIALGVADRFWGMRGDERHYFLGLIFTLVFWEISSRFKKISIALAVAILAVGLISYPLLTDGPIREQNLQHDAEMAACSAAKSD